MKIKEKKLEIVNEVFGSKYGGKVTTPNLVTGVQVMECMVKYADWLINKPYVRNNPSGHNIPSPRFISIADVYRALVLDQKKRSLHATNKLRIFYLIATEYRFESYSKKP